MMYIVGLLQKLSGKYCPGMTRSEACHSHWRSASAFHHGVPSRLILPGKSHL